MATTIIGVDFSGAEKSNSTWVTKGILDGDCLQIKWCCRPSRKRGESHARLEKLLWDLPNGAIAAMDFPFGVPKAFINYLGIQATKMSEIWNYLANIDIEKFHTDRNEFVDVRRKEKQTVLEPKRIGDGLYPSLSPLNKRMRPMTYHGIAMLHRLHHASPQRWHVPPLNHNAAPKNTVTLLEVMPGAYLKTIGLAYKKYKGKGDDAQKQRNGILNSLCAHSGIQLPNLNEHSTKCIGNDDCLDSVVAAVAAAAWAKDSGQFHHPDDNELADAQLEGWLYAPKPQSNQS